MSGRIIVSTATHRRGLLGTLQVASLSATTPRPPLTTSSLCRDAGGEAALLEDSSQPRLEIITASSPRGRMQSGSRVYDDDRLLSLQPHDRYYSPAHNHEPSGSKVDKSRTPVMSEPLQLAGRRWGSRGWSGVGLAVSLAHRSRQR